MTVDNFSGHRFFVERGGDVGDEVELGGPTAHQIARVLRLRVGERIVLLDGTGAERVVELQIVTPSRVIGVVRGTRDARGEPQLEITLYQGLVQRERLELVLQKGTEVGVSAFVPVICERSPARRGEEVDDRRLERWRRIVQEAAEQSRRGRVPTVRRPVRLAEALAEAAAAGPVLVAWEEEEARSVRQGMRALLGERDVSRRLALFIGPVGGLARHEVATAISLGATIVSLGPRILRTETAGPVLAALALYEAGELEP